MKKMKKTIMMVGGMGAGVLMILVAFTSVVNAQSTTSIKKIIDSKVIHINEKQKLLLSPNLYPGYWLDILFTIIVGFIYWFYATIWANIG